MPAGLTDSTGYGLLPTALGAKIRVFTTKYLDPTMMMKLNGGQQGGLVSEIAYVTSQGRKDLPYSGKCSYGANFRIFRMLAVHTKLKIAKF